MYFKQFNIFAAGLESLLGEVGDDGEETDATAGLSLNMMGVALRPITFFTGKGSLMAALWNAPSDLTSALQVSCCLHSLVYLLRA